MSRRLARAGTGSQMDADVQRIADMLAESLAITNQWREKVDRIAHDIDTGGSEKDSFRYWLGVRSAFRMTMVRLEEATQAHESLQRALLDGRDQFDE